MPLKVVGAGLGRTGTASLKKALEKLTGGPCYHMYEVLQHPEHVALWHAVVRGERDPDSIMSGYTAAVDWPAAAFWPELAAASPDAVVLLSSRATPEQWWESFRNTILEVLTRELPGDAPILADHRAMVLDLFAQRFSGDWRDPEAAMAAYERHNERVRREVPPQRLVDWQPGDGWEPICEALGMPVPAEPFPHENSSEEFHDNVEERVESQL